METSILASHNVVYNDGIVSLCKYGKDFVKEVLGIEQIYVKPREYVLSSKKLEGFIKLNEERLYYQKNPVRFIQDFFNIQLVDSQAYLLQKAWITPNVLITASRAYGKSFWIDLFTMAKQMLESDPFSVYIASGSAQQSATTFRKLEDIANDRISSLKGSTGKIFKNEVVVQNAAGDGFSHNPAGFEYKLYNDSFTKTLNSNVDKNRGARARCVIFDECGFLSSDLIQVYKAFCAVDNSFVTGFDSDGNPIDNVRLAAMPKPIPNQLIYVSSASNVETEFYQMYRDYSKQMISGNQDYFVAHIDCDLVMKPTIHNVAIPPMLSKDKIDAAMRTNPEKARREYYCQFTTDAGIDAIIKRGVITRNEEVRRPLLYNDTRDKKFILAYDPARSRDNSVIGVMEVYPVKLKNGDIDLRGRIVNLQNLIDVGKKIKSPMMTPDQVDYLKQMILDYNAGMDGYDNIIKVYIDAGSGGAGVNIADYLMPDWESRDGMPQRGLIDKTYSSDYVGRFPNAVDKIALMSPSEYKSVMYEAMIELVTQDKISFTSTYDNKGYITLFDIDEESLEKEKLKIEERLQKKKLSKEDYEAQLQEELDKVKVLNAINIPLDWAEELALANIDAMKEEVVNMVRKKRESGKDSFDLTPEKANRMHDDRAYVLAMLGYGLMQERRKLVLNKKPTKSPSLVNDLIIRRGKFAGKTI